jgi:hypothetical protein
MEEHSKTVDLNAEVEQFRQDFRVWLGTQSFWYRVRVRIYLYLSRALYRWMFNRPGCWRREQS